MHSAYQQLFAAWLASVFLSIFARVLSSHLIMFSLPFAAYCPPFGLIPPQTHSVGWCDYTLFAAASHCPKVQFAKNIRNTIEFTVYAAFRHSRPTKSRIRGNAASRCFFGCSDRLLQVARILRNPRDDKFFVRNGNCKAGFVRITRF